MSRTTRLASDRGVERTVRYALLAVTAVGVRRRNPSAVLNAALALVATFLPGVVERRYDVSFRPWQRAYADAAMLTHAVGMLGPYEEVWWWDHLTHTHSATLLAGLVHAAARRRGEDPTARVVAVVVGVGLLWELLEQAIHAIADRLDLAPPLIPYGRTDTLFDLAFDLLGALVVLAFGDALLGNFWST